MIRELRAARDLRAACGDDDLVMWAGQGLGRGGRAWVLGDAVVVGCPQVSRRDRLAVWGGTSCAVELVRHALAELGATYRPLGDAELVGEVTAKVDGVEESGRFSWMSLTRAPEEPPARQGSGDGASWGSSGDGAGRLGSGGDPGWLGEGAAAEVAALLAADAPHSYAVPGVAGVS
ncbi:hypothetical protein, partial [Nonomuraea zeae]